MSRTFSKHTLAGVALLALPLAAPASAGSLHGTITTDRGETLTGAIRWDKNENYWDDVLDASKKDKVKVENRGEGLDLRFFGIQVVKGSKDSDTWAQKQFSIPMGHIAVIEPMGGDQVRLELKNGTTLRIIESSDIGDDMRSISIEDQTGGSVDLDWGDIERIEFDAGPDMPARDAARLHGTVETIEGDFTGFVVWDMDESLGEDILDGEEEGRKRKIPFKNIQRIEKLGSWGSLVVLRDGQELELENVNDVDDENRGIEITIPGMGKAEVKWESFRRVVFTEAPASPGYDAFDGGRPIRGSVTMEDGKTVAGAIVWDRDEEFSWEAIDGKIGDVEIQILFENIASIERTSDKSAKVTLRDGLELTLEDSNDVNDENKGIVVTGDDGTVWELNWSAFEKLELGS